MGACFDRLRCEVFQNLFLSPMNTGFVRLAKLQQYLPFTVLKLINGLVGEQLQESCNSTYRLRY